MWMVPLILSAIAYRAVYVRQSCGENWFRHIDLSGILANLSAPRVLFWMLAGLSVWPFVFMRGSSRLCAPISQTGFTPRDHDARLRARLR